MLNLKGRTEVDSFRAGVAYGALPPPPVTGAQGQSQEITAELHEHYVSRNPSLYQYQSTNCLVHYILTSPRFGSNVFGIL